MEEDINPAIAGSLKNISGKLTEWKEKPLLLSEEETLREVADISDGILSGVIKDIPEKEGVSEKE